MRTKENAHLSTYYTNKTVRKKIDIKLARIATLNAGLGSDSDEQEIKKVNRKIKKISLEIKEIDQDFYETAFAIDA